MQTDFVQEILSDLIDFPENQMRKDVDREELHALADNIQANGLINPITVRKVGERYELVAGQRRLMAMRIAGIIRIPCVVRELDEGAALNIMAAENLERRDVDPVDEANFIKRIMDETGATVGDMATRLNRGEQYVRDRLAVAFMPDYMQEYLKSGELKLGVALVLAQIEPDEKRAIWVAMAVRDNVSQRVAAHWLYEHKIGLLPSYAPPEGETPGVPAPEFQVQMFTCAVDGREYPAKECTAVFVYRGNVPYLESIRDELNREHYTPSPDTGPGLSQDPGCA